MTEYRNDIDAFEGEDELDDRCDLDPNKICDNCCKCLETEDKEYRTIMANFLTEDTIIEYAPDGDCVPMKKPFGDYSTLPARAERRRR